MSDPIMVNLGDVIDVYGELFVCVLVEKQTHGYPRVEFISKAEAEYVSHHDTFFADNQELYRRETEDALGITREARGYLKGQCSNVSPLNLGSLYCTLPIGHGTGSNDTVQDSYHRNPTNNTVWAD